MWSPPERRVIVLSFAPFSGMLLEPQQWRCCMMKKTFLIHHHKTEVVSWNQLARSEERADECGRWCNRLWIDEDTVRGLNNSNAADCQNAGEDLASLRGLETIKCPCFLGNVIRFTNLLVYFLTDNVKMPPVLYSSIKKTQLWPFSRCWTYVHGGVDLTDGFVVCWELVDLDTVAHQFAHDLDFELVQLTLGDCVCFGNNGDNIDLWKGGERGGRVCEWSAWFLSQTVPNAFVREYPELHWRLIHDGKPIKVHVVDGACRTHFNVMKKQ